MVWLSKNPADFAYPFTDYQHFTLQNSRFLLYKIEEFHFTDCKNHGKDLANPTNHRQKIRNDALDFIESRATAISSI